MKVQYLMLDGKEGFPLSIVVENEREYRAVRQALLTAATKMPLLMPWDYDSQCIISDLAVKIIKLGPTKE